MKLFKFSTSRRTLDQNHTGKETLPMGATCQANAPKQNERMSAGPINAKFIARAMDAYGSMVLRLALSHVRSMPDAEDAFQDVFVRLMGCQTDFASSEHLKAWLIRTTINRCRDAQRARTRTQTHTEPLSERHAETLPDYQTLRAARNFPLKLRIPMEARAMQRTSCKLFAFNPLPQETR